MYNAQYVLMAGTSPIYYSDSKDKLKQVVEMYPQSARKKMRIVHVKMANITYSGKREYVKK